MSVTEKSYFYEALEIFHIEQGTPLASYPRINGQLLDLFHLYNLVTQNGGLLNVNSQNLWFKIIDKLDCLPKSCLNQIVAIKQVYIRFLEGFEKVHYFNPKVEEEDTKFKAPEVNCVPMSYNYEQHLIEENLRMKFNFAPKLRTHEYEKICLSLISPLPNEHDFAINICAVLSVEGRRTLNLTLFPKLLTFLVAHAGIYSHSNLRQLFEQISPDYNQNDDFWNSTLNSTPYHYLLNEKNFTESTIVNIQQEDTEENFFTNLNCPKIFKIVTILRNLSFIQHNVEFLANSEEFLRFALCCAGNFALKLSGLDILRNIAKYIKTDFLLQDLLNLIFDCLNSEDRSLNFAALDFISEFAYSGQIEGLIYYLNDENLKKILNFLTINDVYLLIASLECLISITSLNTQLSNKIGHIAHLDIFISLLSYDLTSNQGALKIYTVNSQEMYDNFDTEKILYNWLHLNVEIENTSFIDQEGFYLKYQNYCSLNDFEIVSPILFCHILSRVFKFELIKIEDSFFYKGLKFKTDLKLSKKIYDELNTVGNEVVKETPKKRVTFDVKQLISVCQWRGCLKKCSNSRALFVHAVQNHSAEKENEVVCFWTGCDSTIRRKKFSHLTHLFEFHCSGNIGKIIGPLPKTVNEILRERNILRSEKCKYEGPVTRAVRLGAALVLSNLGKHAKSPKQFLGRLEQDVVERAASQPDSSYSLAELLFTLINPI